MLTLYWPAYEHSEFLDQVLARIRHDFGNPVSTLKITLELLLRNHGQMSPVKQNAFLKRALEAVDSQQVYLDAIKRYARASVRLVKPFSFAAFWKGYTAAIAEDIGGPSLCLQIDRFEHDVTLAADAGALRLVLDELVQNSLAAVADRSDPEIKFGCREGDRTLTILVTDNGCGFSHDRIAEAFLPFHSTKPGCAGVGLPIAQKLVHQMNGRLFIHSNGHHGTTVSVELSKAMPN